jgi:hypothetical protein
MTKEDAVKAAALGIPVQRTDPTTGKVTVYKRISAVVWRYATLDNVYDGKRVEVELQAANGARSVSIVPVEQVEEINRELWDVQKTIEVDAEEKKKPKEKKTVFRRPSVGEVAAFATENLLRIDAQAFVDHYDACGWVVGRNKPMKDWKAAVRNWERRQASFVNAEKTDDAKGSDGSFETDEFFRSALSRSYSDDVLDGLKL